MNPAPEPGRISLINGGSLAEPPSAVQRRIRQSRVPENHLLWLDESHCVAIIKAKVLHN